MDGHEHPTFDHRSLTLANQGDTARAVATGAAIGQAKTSVHRDSYVVMLLARSHARMNFPKSASLPDEAGPEIQIQAFWGDTTHGACRCWPQ